MHVPRPLVSRLLAGFFLILPSAKALAEETPARYVHALAQYESLSADERVEWFGWLLTHRLQPACAATMDREAFERVQQRSLAKLDRMRAGQSLSRADVLRVLEYIDRRETAVLGLQSELFRRTAQQAVGTNVWEYQQRVGFAEAVRRACEHSQHPFEAQPKLISWFDASILQQRLTSRPPLPPVPDFDLMNDRAWIADAHAQAPEVLTARDDAPDAEKLASRIVGYNAELKQLEDALFSTQSYNVDELNRVVDHLARLGLARIRLASDVLALPADQRASAGEISSLDDAIELARAKVSAARRAASRVLNRREDQQQWTVLKQLNQVDQRLDTLSTGPDR